VLDVEVASPMGLRVRPVITDTLEALVVETANGDRVVTALFDKARADGAVEAEVGETQLHGLAEQSAVIRIRASGDIEVIPKTGRQVKLGGTGATKGVNRIGDPLVPGTLFVSAMNLSGGGVTITLTYQAPGTPPPPPVVVPIVLVMAGMTVQTEVPLPGLPIVLGGVTGTGSLVVKSVD
jgi:hypothetical protein